MLDSRKPWKVSGQGIAFELHDSGDDREDGLGLAESRGRQTRWEGILTVQGRDLVRGLQTRTAAERLKGRLGLRNF